MTSGNGNANEFGKHIGERTLWMLAAITILIVLGLTIYLFQPYLKQYPDSYIRIYTVLGLTSILLLVPVFYVFFWKDYRTEYILIYVFALLIPLSYLFDIDALFFIPLTLQLILLIKTKKKLMPHS